MPGIHYYPILQCNPTRARPVYLHHSEDESDEVNEQLAVDSTQLTHTVFFRYPDCSLLEAEPDNAIRLINPQDAHERYPFEDLVEDASVIRNASQLNEGETSFFLISEIDARHTPFRNGGAVPRLMPMRPGTDGLTLLLHDVEAYQKTVGKTSLRVITFERHDDDERDMIYRVARKSRCQARNGIWAENTRSYEFSTDRLIAAQHVDTPSPLVFMLIDLIWRASARAVRHVRFTLGESEYLEDGADTDFLPSRRVRFADALDAILEPVKRDEIDLDENTDTAEDRVQPDECPICSGPYVFDTEDTHRPVRLRPCGHIFGYECIKTWCNTEVIEHGTLKTPQCPCRCDIFDARAVKLREQNGTYHNLPTFTAYENFEVSCADLDAATPVRHVDDKHVTINARVMAHALKMLTDGALLEEAISTPFNLQTIRYAETQLAVASIREFLNANNGRPLTYGVLFRYLYIAIINVLLGKCKQSMYPQFLSEQDRNNVTLRYWATHKAAPIREGFYEFVDRLLHRMIMFQELRQCECSPGFHMHGARTFWNKDSFPVRDAPAGPLHNEIHELLHGPRS